jgi:putative flippase GtrA
MQPPTFLGAGRGVPLAQAASYVLAAAAATVLNIAAQEITRKAFSEDALLASLSAGTAIGFIAKYLLDKEFVFADPYTGPSGESRKLILSLLFSVATTLLFWATEVIFWLVWQTQESKYAGAALGLAIGYGAKFVLDRAFVFRGRAA